MSLAKAIQAAEYRALALAGNGIPLGAPWQNLIDEAKRALQDLAPAPDGGRTIYMVGDPWQINGPKIFDAADGTQLMDVVAMELDIAVGEAPTAVLTAPDGAKELVSVVASGGMIATETTRPTAWTPPGEVVYPCRAPCKDCNGTGEYQGLTAVEPCRTCNP